jgi:hypothetical protein
MVSFIGVAASANGPINRYIKRVVLVDVVASVLMIDAMIFE